MPDFKAMARNDQIVLGSGLLVFIASFLPWDGASVPSVTINGLHVGGGSFTISAWHSYSVLALLLFLAGALVAAVAIFARESIPDLPVSPRVLVAGLFGLGTVLELIRMLTLHHGDGVSIRWGGYILAIAMIAGTVVAAMSAREEMSGSGASAPAAPPI